MSRRNQRNANARVANALGMSAAPSVAIRPDAAVSQRLRVPVAVNPAFLARVRDSVTRLRNGESRTEVILRHGSCVALEAEADLQRLRNGIVEAGR